MTMNMFLFLGVFVSCVLPRATSFEPVDWDESHIRAAALLSSMTEDEKFSLMSGIGWDDFPIIHKGPNKLWWYCGNTPAISRLGIPSLNLQDAAGGYRDQWEATAGTSTCWPSLLATAATFSPSTVRDLGLALAEEFSYKGANMILGPSINVHRVARNGRNFEYLSGEDPFLGAQLAEAYVQGVQSGGVAAVMKHFAFNSQETNRHTESSVVDDKTAHELYLPPFRSAVDAGVTATMCSYNSINGTPACSNAKYLKDVLKGEFGFRGFVQSDWWATHAASDVEMGLDQDMPGTDKHFSPSDLRKLGDNATAAVDGAVQRILAAMYHMNLFNSTQCAAPAESFISRNASSMAHRSLARKIATESVVLLRNEDNLLPLATTGTKIAVVGKAASTRQSDKWGPFHWFEGGDYYSGGGSGHVTASYVVTPLDGLSWTADDGAIVATSTSNDASAAVEAARVADVTVVVVATTSQEGKDRTSLALDDDADALVRAVAGVNTTKTVVLVQTPGAVIMPWVDDVDAIAMMFLGGEETGAAWADVLFGLHDPTGRLPIMLPLTEENDTIPPSSMATVEYSEGLATSYRNPNFKAAFPFGHGLSYTKFLFENVSCCVRNSKDGDDADGLDFSVSVTITNVGAREGQATPMLFLEFPAEAKYPAPFLKGFQRTSQVKPGEASVVTFSLSAADRSYWSEATSGWVLASQSGLVAHIGASSEDTRGAVSLASCSREGEMGHCS